MIGHPHLWLSGLKESDVIEFLVSGGPVMVPIGLASVIALAVFIERVIALRQHNNIPDGFAIEIDDLLSQGRTADAMTLCKKNGCSVARVVTVAIQAAGKTRPEIKERIEEVGRREAAALERFSQVLGTVASVAPLLGLLGTVWGMILTFDVIRAQQGMDVASLAGGISQALITTMAGLSVGIPALISYRWVLSRVDELVLGMEEVAIAVLDRVCSIEEEA